MKTKIIKKAGSPAKVIKKGVAWRRDDMSENAAVNISA